MVQATVNYWDVLDRCNPKSVLVRTQDIIGDDDIQLFEVFYKMNNRLRYCNGSYYTFKDSEWDIKYNEWIKSDDYKSKSFNLYYGGGVVD